MSKASYSLKLPASVKEAAARLAKKVGEGARKSVTGDSEKREIR